MLKYIAKNSFHYVKILKRMTYTNEQYKGGEKVLKFYSMCADIYKDNKEKKRQLVKCIYNLLVFSLQGIPAKKKLV